MLAALILFVFSACMVHAAITDLLSMTIANRVSAILILTFAVVAPLAGMGWDQYGMHVAAGVLVLAVGVAFFAMGAMGGGDAKLMAATALWMGFGPALSSYLVVSTVAGGVLTLLILIYRRSPLAAATGHHAMLRHFADPKEGVPYGIALGVGGLVAFPASALGAWAIAALTWK